MKRTFLLFLLLVLCSATLFAAGKVYWQADGVLVTGIDGMGIGDLVTDMRGGAYIVTSDLYKVYLIRVDKNGNLPWGLSGITVDTNTYGAFQMNTLGVSDSCGGVIIVWDKFFPTGHRLYAQRVDSSGNNVWIAGGRLVSLSDSSQEEHVVVSDNQKGVIAAWQESWNGQYDIYAQRLDSSGVRKWGGNGKVVCNASSNQELPKIAINNVGQMMVCWWDARNDAGDVYGQCVDFGGTIRWSINGIAIADTNDYQVAPSIVLGYNSEWLVSWHDKRTGNFDVYAQCLDSSANLLWTYNGMPVCTTSNAQRLPQSVCNDNGGMITVWIDERNNNYDLYTQQVTAEGDLKWDSNGIVICNADSNQENQKIIKDNHQGALICWQDNRSGNSDIYAQHVDSSGSVKWELNGMVVCSTAGSQERPKMVASDSGTAIIAWDDGRSGQWRAYAQRVGDDPNGVTGEPEDRIQKAEFRIYQNSPNPFRQTTMIKYQIPKSGIVSLKVYNITGQLVKTLINENKQQGYYNVKWDGKDESGQQAAAGVYFYRLQAKEFNNTKKLVVLK